MSLKVNISQQSCGAEIIGADLTKDLSDSEVVEIRNLWLDHHVLSFPNQSLDDDDLERFTLYFGSFGK
jgi:Probable taurine catabolism dioxygenase